jgi:hypothetical protein
MLVKREQRKPYDASALQAEIERNLDLIVKRQDECGVDIGNDGETPRVGFSTYTTERMAGFGGESRREPTLDTIKFPGFADYMARQIGISDELAKVWNAPQAVGKLEYDPSFAEAKSESAAYKASLKRTGSRSPHDGRVTRHRFDHDAARAQQSSTRPMPTTSWGSRTNSRKNTNISSARDISCSWTRPTSRWSGSSCSAISR